MNHVSQTLHLGYRWLEEKQQLLPLSKCDEREREREQLTAMVGGGERRPSEVYSMEE